MESYVSLRKRAKLDILLTSEGPKPPKGEEKKSYNINDRALSVSECFPIFFFFDCSDMVFDGYYRLNN